MNVAKLTGYEKIVTENKKLRELIDEFSYAQCFAIVDPTACRWCIFSDNGRCKLDEKIRKLRQ